MTGEWVLSQVREQQLGNSHLIRLLGQGSFSKVYLGEHLSLNTQAAVKVLRAPVELDEVQ